MLSTQARSRVARQAGALRARLGISGVILCGVWASACADDRQDGGGETPNSTLDVHFSPKGGCFVSSQTVSLSTDADAALYYTVDGSIPTEKSLAYDGPLRLEESTRIRAVAVQRQPVGSGGQGGSSAAGASGSIAVRKGAVAASRYFKVSAETAGFTSHLPVLMIHTFESKELPQNGLDHQPAQLLVFEPEASVTRVVGPAAWDVRIGIHVRGSTSRDFAKKQYALELRKESDDSDQARPLLGMPAGSDWVISDPIALDRSLIRNALGFELSRRIGRYAPRTRFVEVYLAERGGVMGQPNFLGFFSLMEKPRRSPARVDVRPLAAGGTGEDWTGGYLLKIDKGESDFQAAGKQFQFVYPDGLWMRQPAQADYLRYLGNFIQDFSAAVRSADFKHPQSGRHYSEFIDVGTWIDHNILNALLKNVDGLRISAYFYKDRAGALAAGPLWDLDRSAGTPYDERSKNPEEWKLAGSDGTDYFTEGFWGPLFRDPEFKVRYGARFRELLSGPFSAEALDAVVDRLANEVGPAATRNFQRWPDSPPRGGTHAAEIAILKDFLRRRVAWIQKRLQSDFR